MHNTPNIFTSNSRYLPPPIRTVSQPDYAHRRSDCQRAAVFLNQDWAPTPTSVTSSNFVAQVLPSPSSSELPPPPPPRSECSHSEDDSEEDTPSSASSPVKREPFSPEPSPGYQHQLPHILPARRASLSMNDLQSLAGRRHSVGNDSYLVSRSLGSASLSVDRRVRSSPYSHHQQTRSWPVALHPSASSHPQPTPSGSGHRRNPSDNSHSTGSPPQTPPTPSSPALSAKNESAQSSSTASPPATVNTDGYIQRISGGKSKCVWNDASGNECGFQSSSSLVKRHVRTVHLKIRPVVCPECGQSFATKFHLKTHQNIHTGQKPYSCPDCTKTFSNPSSRHHHRVRYHGYVQTWRHYGGKNEKN